MGKRQRRKPVPCLLCSNETWDADQICSACRHFHKVGSETEASRKAHNTGKFPYLLPRDVMWRYRGGFNFRDFIEAMTGEPASAVKWDEYETDNPLKLHERIILPEYLPEEKRRGYWNGKRAFDSMPIVQFYLTEAQGKALTLLLHSVDAFIKETRRAGERDGSSFLRQMASGDLSMEQVNNWHTHIEAK